MVGKRSGLDGAGRSCAGVAFLLWLGIGIGGAAAFSLCGCSGEEEPVAEGRSMLCIGRKAPGLFVDAFSFNGETVEPDGLLLEEHCFLEFLPLAHGKKRRGARLDAWIRADGEESSLVEATPLFLRDERFEKEKNLDALRRLLRIDLGRFTGKKISIRWVMHAGGERIAGALGGLKILPVAERTPRKPHILFICSDTHRFEYALGEEGARLMPALGELIEGSVVYTNAFSSSSWTLPSVVSTFTGLFPRYHGTGFRRGRMTPAEHESRGFPPGVCGFLVAGDYRLLTVYPEGLSTLTEILRGEGYRTAMVVSNPLYHLSGLFADGQDVVIRTGVVPGERVNRAVRRYLDARPDDRPLFLLVHYMDVHHWRPWYFNERFPGLAPAGHRDGVIAAYESAVRDVDAGLKGLLDMWESAVGLEESLVVFYSDHGEHLFDAGEPATGHGNSQSEVLLHVPLVVHYPVWLGRSPALSDEPVSLLDLFPTVLAVAGIDGAAGTRQGRSLLAPALSDRPAPRVFYADSQLHGDEMASVREGPFKLVFNFARGKRTLFDLRLSRSSRGEPGQEVTDAALRERIEERLQNLYDAYRAAGERYSAPFVSRSVVGGKEATEGMEALGYTR